MMKSAKLFAVSLYALSTVTSILAPLSPADAQARKQYPPDPPEPASVRFHYARAAALAAGDPALERWQKDGFYCRSPNGGSAWADLNPRDDHHKPEKAFDNLWMFGTTEVHAWLLKTDAGLVLFDTLDNPQEAQNIIEADMKKFGLNPADIKYVFITHGHGDHYGGAKYFQDKYHARVATADWDYIINTPARENGPPKPNKDITVTDGQDFKIGSVTIHAILSPGHTPATESFIFPVKDKGVERIMFMMGGTNYGKTQIGLAQEHESLHKVWEAVDAYKAVGIINPHAWVYNADEKFAAMGKSKTNPFVIGTAEVDKTLAIQDECTIAAQGWMASYGWK